MDKTLITSKTVWAAAIINGLAAALQQFGIVITIDQLAAINLVVASIMRYITKDPIAGVVKA